MNWLLIAVVLLGLLLIAVVVVRVVLMRSVDNIDGFGGVHKGKEKIIASLGDSNQQGK